MLIRIAAGVVLVCTLSLSALLAQSPAPSQSQNAAVNPAVTEQIAKANRLLAGQNYDKAIKEFKAASKMVQNNCYDAFVGLALCYQGLKDDKKAVESATRALETASDDQERARAHNLAGLSLLELGNSNRDKLKNAEREFRTALQLDPDWEFVHFNLGMCLMKQSRDDEGIAEMKTYIEQHPRSSAVERARKMMADPRRAREIFVPDFSITTMNGQQISTADLVGKVVVLDFWASWCGPCRSSLGDLRSFTKHFADKPVVLISISADEDEETWRKFVSSNNMIWPQYFDEGRRIARLFGVRAYPSYFVIDTEGIFRMKILGAGNFQVGTVQEEVKKWLKKMDEGSKKKETASAAK